jgi:cell division protease FtsH
MCEGLMFLSFPDQRVVIEVHESPSREKTVHIMTGHDAGLFLDQWFAFSQLNNYLKGQAFFADGKIIERKKVYRWEDIVLPEATKRAIQIHVNQFLHNREALKKLGVKGRRGVILAGPPGTGKTLIGKILADTLEVSFIWVIPRHIEDIRSFGDILSLARHISPTVIFLEDLDLFAEERERGGLLGLGELMNQLDGAMDNEDIVTIATTNRLEVIEKALRNRPGRFDRVITIDTMDPPCRRRMLDKLLAKVDVAPETLHRLVHATDGYTGAQVEELVNTLFIHAVDTHSGGVDPATEGMLNLDRQVDSALQEMSQDGKNRMGFQPV